MSSDEQEKNRPSHTVSFARINGRDDDGNDKLGPARQIGSVWPRAGREGDGILRFDHIPEEMSAEGGGVVFLRKIDALRSERKEGASRKKDRERDA
jgi:hypothetical protein